MKIGILICGHFLDDIAATYGTYLDLYAPMLGEGFDCTAYFVVDGEMPESVDEQDGWLISGSRHGAYEDHAWIPPFEDFLRRAYSAEVPIVGICFGHQILAQALGGTVEKYSGGWSLGPVEYGFKDGSSQTVVAVHQDQVTALPEGAEVISSTDFCAFAGLAYGAKALSFQPHPEFSEAFITDLIDFYDEAKKLPDDVLKAARKTLDLDLNNGGMIEQIRGFLQTAHADRTRASRAA